MKSSGVPRPPPRRNPYSSASSYTPATEPLTINTEQKIEVESGNPSHPDEIKTNSDYRISSYDPSSSKGQSFEKAVAEFDSQEGIFDQ